jgi:hypothetical protein
VSDHGRPAATEKENQMTLSALILYPLTHRVVHELDWQRITMTANAAYAAAVSAPVKGKRTTSRKAR